ncbi:cupin domain-containing protein [Mycobacterium sp. 21AC1]|uniref:cupin domain-containing protein n=1 Tax=[Mycobacterium] appelbergii TaxID=2939269 RepID=UPI002938F9A6|nr:cupin domain-containing protein [Mycobacterium sp. 21AC1]MDV3123934.1 cupin domain-containing protein [Mycobacterium sp. 21AC1]
MTFQGDGAPVAPAILTPETQQAVWFLGALVRIRASGDSTSGHLDLLEHHGERGYGSPLHRHLAEEETFFVLDGELRVEVGGEAHSAGPGAVAFLPRQLPHAFVVTSPYARFLTLHTPGGFDRFTVTVGTPAEDTPTMPPDDVPTDPAALAAIASSYGIEILGPPPMP